MDWLKRKRLWVVVGIVILVPVVAIAGYLGLPLFIDTIVEEEFPFAEAAVVPADMTRKQVEDTMATMAKMDSPMEDAMPKEMPEATVIKTGQLKDADSFHKGSGTAKVFRLPDGSIVLRLESLKVTNGPDLHVVLTPHSDPDGRDDVHEEGYIDLGKLKGNIGNQNYPFPEGVDPAELNALVIYCKPFHVIFSVAQLN